MTEDLSVLFFRETVDDMCQETEQGSCIAAVQTIISVAVRIFGCLCIQLDLSGNCLVQLNGIGDVHSAIQVDIAVKAYGNVSIACCRRSGACIFRCGRDLCGNRCCFSSCFRRRNGRFGFCTAFADRRFTGRGFCLRCRGCGQRFSCICGFGRGCGGRIRFVVVIFIYQSDRVVCCSDVSTAGSILFRGCPPALQLCGGVIAEACDRRGLFVYNDGVLIVKGNGDVVGVQTILERLVAPYLIRALQPC